MKLYETKGNQIAIAMTLMTVLLAAAQTVFA
jgi:hypothetical protein